MLYKYKAGLINRPVDVNCGLLILTRYSSFMLHS